LSSPKPKADSPNVVCIIAEQSFIHGSYSTGHPEDRFSALVDRYATSDIEALLQAAIKSLHCSDKKGKAIKALKKSSHK
jgi:hypothetical protein